MNKYKKEGGVLREDFCASCLSLIPAAAGLGGIGISTSAKKARKWKTALFWGSLALTIISVIVFIYFKTKCSTCR